MTFHPNQDLMLEILSLSTPQAVAKFRLLSREYNELTYRSYFTKKHYERSNYVSGCFLQRVCRRFRHLSRYVAFSNAEMVAGNLVRELSLDFLPSRNPEIVACDSTHGIMLCILHDPPRDTIPSYVVCKPSTKQWRYIPKPKTRYAMHNHGIMVMRKNPLEFKIVRLSKSNFHKTSKRSELYTLRCEIFDSEKWTWTEMENVSLPEGTFMYPDPAVIASGWIHWRIWGDYILAYEVEKETWISFPIPKEILSDCEKYKIVKYEDRFGVIRVLKDCKNSELWVLKSHKEMKFVRNQSLNTELLENCCGPLAFGSSDVLACWTENYYLALYEFERAVVEKIRLEDYHYCDAFPFCSDFEPVNMLGSSLKNQKNHVKKKREKTTSGQDVKCTILEDSVNDVPERHMNKISY